MLAGKFLKAVCKRTIIPSSVGADGDLPSCGGRDLLLLFCEHLQEPSLVLADCVQDAQGDVTHSWLRDASTECRGAMEMAARVVIQGNEKLLKHRQGPAPFCIDVQLIVKHVPPERRPHPPRSKRLELGMIEHTNVVGSPVIHFRLPHQLRIHHLLKFLNVLSPPNMQILPHTVHC
jgi:hypothetical protein